MLDQGEHIFASHHSKGLNRGVVVVPGGDAACGQEQPLAGLGLQAPYMAQVLQICDEQWSIRIGRRMLLDCKSVRRNPTRMLDRRSCSDTRGYSRQITHEMIDRVPIDWWSTIPRHVIAEPAKLADIDLSRS